jgi:hypothetical protein
MSTIVVNTNGENIWRSRKSGSQKPLLIKRTPGCALMFPFFDEDFVIFQLL